MAICAGKLSENLGICVSIVTVNTHPVVISYSK